MRQLPVNPPARTRVSHVQGVLCSIARWSLVGRVAHAPSKATPPRVGPVLTVSGTFL